MTWNLIDKLLPTLKPLVDATEALASESYPSVSCMILMITGLIKNDLSTKPDDTETIETFKVKVIVGLRSRFAPLMISCLHKVLLLCPFCWIPGIKILQL